MKWSNRRVLEDVKIRDTVIIAAVCLALTFPAFLSSGSYPSGIDTPAHIFKVQQMETMLLEDGKIFHWNDNWYNGYPFLTIYPPLAYWLLLGIDVVAGDITLSLNILRFSLFFVTAYLTYLLVTREFQDGRLGLAAGVLVAGSYPIYQNLFLVNRLGFAAGFVFYIAALLMMLDEELYRKEPGRRHLLLGVLLGVSVLAHSNASYLLVYTALFVALVYPDRMRRLGLVPAALTALVAFIVALPYLSTFLQHSWLLETSWVNSGPLSLSLIVSRSFLDSVPHYFGFVHVGLLALGLVMLVYRRSRFLKLALLNLGFFSLLFWSQSLNILKYVPLGRQFDLWKIEIFLAFWGIGIAVHGLASIRELTREYLDFRLFLLVLGLIMLVDVSPMVSQSSNWSPSWDPDDIRGEIETENAYRGIAVGMRHWDDYLLPVELGLPNTFGWFTQGNPHRYFSSVLRKFSGFIYPVDYQIGGLDGYGGDRESLRKALRKNMMELSNTKYVFLGKDWIGQEDSMPILGNYPVDNPKNSRFREELESDPEFIEVHDSAAVTVYEFNRSIEFCRVVEPEWVETDYRRSAVVSLLSERLLPQVLVRGKAVQRPNTAESVECGKSDPYSISVSTEEPGWILVKESYYPYWDREGDKDIYYAYGLMVTHVDGTAELTYTPGSGGLRS